MSPPISTPIGSSKSYHRTKKSQAQRTDDNKPQLSTSSMLSQAQLYSTSSAQLANVVPRRTERKRAMTDRFSPSKSYGAEGAASEDAPADADVDFAEEGATINAPEAIDADFTEDGIDRAEEKNASKKAVSEEDASKEVTSEEAAPGVAASTASSVDKEANCSSKRKSDANRSSGSARHSTHGPSDLVDSNNDMSDGSVFTSTPGAPREISTDCPRKKKRRRRKAVGHAESTLVAEAPRRSSRTRSSTDFYYPGIRFLAVPKRGSAGVAEKGSGPQKADIARYDAGKRRRSERKSKPTDFFINREQNAGATSHANPPIAASRTTPTSTSSLKAPRKQKAGITSAEQCETHSSREKRRLRKSTDFYRPPKATDAAASHERLRKRTDFYRPPKAASSRASRAKKNNGASCQASPAVSASSSTSSATVNTAPETTRSRVPADFYTPPTDTDTSTAATLTENTETGPPLGKKQHGLPARRGNKNNATYAKHSTGKLASRNVEIPKVKRAYSEYEDKKGEGKSRNARDNKTKSAHHDVEDKRGERASRGDGEDEVARRGNDEAFGGSNSEQTRGRGARTRDVPPPKKQNLLDHLMK